MRLNILSMCTVAAITFSASVTYATTCTGFIADGVTKIANAVTNTDGCEFGSTSQDSVTQVNLDGLFGFTDWALIAKDNGLNGTDEGTTTALTLTGTTLAGSWSVDSSLFSIFSNLVLVFKQANDNAGFTPSTYVSYLVDSTAPFSGTYDSMFQKSNAGELSHVSLYGQGDGNNNQPPPVPLPAGGVLLLTGLFGLGAAARRRKRK